MNALRAAIFDLDGTLVDSERIHERAMQDVWNKRCPGFVLPEGWTSLVRGMLIVDRATLLQKRTGAAYDVQTFAAEIEERFDVIHAREGLPAMPDADRVLTEGVAAGWMLALASNGARGYVESVLRERGWLAMFDAIVACDGECAPKPDPQSYQEAMRQLGVSSNECIAIEDALTGMEAAHAAGMRVIAVTNDHVPAWVARHIFSLKELTLKNKEMLSEARTLI